MLCVLFFVLLALVAGRKSANLHQAGTEELYQTDPTQLNRWKLSPGLYADADIRAGRVCSQRDMQVQDSDPGFQKVLNIGSYLLSHFHQQLGEPTAALSRLGPWQQFESIRDQRSSFYCTQYSAMFAFFCRINGLACREIECKGKNDRHIFNETYLPESGVWMYTDLTHGILSITRKGTSERLAGLYDVLHARDSVPDGVYLTFDRDSVVVKPLSAIAPALRYNFDPGCRFYYYQHADLQRKWTPGDWLRKPSALIYAKHRVWSKWRIVQGLAWLLVAGFLLSLYKDFRSGRLKKA